MESFKTVQQSNVAVSPGSRISLGVITLEIGGTSETVVVKAENSLIQVTSGERSFTIPTESVQNLPFANRGFTTLAALAPGVTGTTAQGTQSCMSTNIVMDGVSTMDTGSSGAAIFNINTESISEVKVLESGYQAEYGLRSGLQVMAVTKSGTNQFHGSAYNVRRNSKWNSNSKANELNGVPKPVSKAQDIGFSVGGPVGKPGGRNKLFFFFAEEFNPATAGGTQQTFRLPTALERQGDFSQSRDNLGNLYPYIKDPLLSGACTAADQTACFRDGGVVGRIPQDRLYSLGLNILKMYPMPNDQSTTIGTNHQFIQPTYDTLLYQPALRLDYQMTPGLRFSFKYAGNNNAKRASLGSLPGWNDTIVPIPKKGTEVVTVTYNLSSTTFLEGTYGRAGNQLAGCGGLSINDVSDSRDHRPGEPAADLPGGQRHQPRLLRLRDPELPEPALLGRDADLQSAGVPVGNRVVQDTAVAGQSAAERDLPRLPQHQHDAGRRGQPHARSRPSHPEGRLLQQPQPEA